MTTVLFPEMHLPETCEMQQKKYRFAQEHADAIIAVSENTKRDVIRLLGIDPEKIFVVHEGVDPAFRPLPASAVKAAIAPLGLEPGGYILHVGTIEPRKNLMRLIEAYRLVRQELSSIAPKLVLAGASGWLNRELFDRVRTLEMDDQVIFLGKVAENLLPVLYNGALIFVYPSLYEGFGLPPLEAMACGVPVITSEASSLPEVAGKAGILVDPKDTHALAASITELLENSKERERLAGAGLEQARKFTWNLAARQTINIYQTLLDR
jgi:glycosyltransferase involved in cell wall biosynthesis